MSAPAAVKSAMSASVRMLSAASVNTPGGVHFACRQHDAVPHGRLKFAQRLDDGRVGHAHAGVAGEEDEIHPQFLGA